jgi:phosphonate transport system substrate-binding protein
MDNGLQAADFSEISFAPGPGGKQEKVVLAVHAGKYDIGSIREGTLDVVRDKVDLSQIRVLAHTPWYPSWVYAARTSLDPKIRDAIAEALQRLDPEVPQHRAILAQAGFERVIPSTDSDFDSIRSLVQKIGPIRHE